MLLLAWIIEGDFRQKYRLLKENKIIWIFLILPLLHLIWLINTSDFQYALKDIKIKLPLLVFPLLLGTSKPLSGKELKLVMASFVIAVFSGTMVTSAILAGIYPHPHQNVRDSSIFISHIRFGLMILFSLAILFFYLLPEQNVRKSKKRYYLIPLFIWFLIFLVILQSLTSWVIFFLSGYILFIVFYGHIQSPKIRAGIWLFLITLLLFIGALFGKVTYDFYFRPNLPFSELPEKTVHGNMYYNDTISTRKENGYYIDILICKDEMRKTWSDLSQLPYEGKDFNGFPIESTLIRYLASKGLPKDEDGIKQLDREDINMIEKGYASCVYRNRFIPYVKIYELFWELDTYFKEGDANGKSVAQRFEYSKTALHIIARNFWFGVGTGDLDAAYEKAYQEIHSKLNREFQHRAHNQYLTFLVAFGLFGFLASLFSMFGPAWKAGIRNNFLLGSFLTIIFLSMLNEDTLETQAGVSFFIFFYALLLFSEKTKP